MPRVSDRQKSLRIVKDKLYLELALESSGESDYVSHSDCTSSSGIDFDMNSDDSNSDSDFDMLADSDSDEESNLESLEFGGHSNEVHELYFVMYNCRYHVPRPATGKSKDFCRHYFDMLPEKLFRQMVRMNKNTFFVLVALIESHLIFVNRSHHAQAPVEWQLACTLDRLGHNGNGACLNHMIPIWGVSSGSVNNFTSRCFVALESALKDSVKWPNAVERHHIQQEFGKLGFLGCVGLIDGTLLPLSQRPKLCGECYFDRKSNYSVNAQVVCDYKRRILFIYAGMPGSCCDITCYRKSPLFRRCNDARLFGEGQYLLGDSGYMTGTSIVAAYKNSANNRDKEQFNICVAKARVTNEHCIGVLKSRWHSLKEIRTQLNEKADSIHMVKWIALCAKLHNFVDTQGDVWTEADQPIEIDNDDVPGLDDMHPLHGPPVAASMLLARVQQNTLAWNRRPGGCLYHGPTL